MITVRKPRRRIRLQEWDAHWLYGLLFLLALMTLGSLTSCNREEASPEPNSCGTSATVKDLTGLDGCGFVLVLDNGEKLEPVLDIIRCGTPPVPPPAINGIALEDGMRVRVTYEELKDRGSVCMAGKIVKVTCISEVPSKINPSYNSTFLLS